MYLSRLLIGVSLLSGLFSLGSNAHAVELSGYAETRVRLGDSESCRDATPDGVHSIRNCPELSLKLSHTVGEADGGDGAEGDDFFSDFGSKPEPKMPEMWLHLESSVNPFGASALQTSGGFVLHPTSNISVFAGKDSIVWGKADLINPIDVINSEDFTQFLVLEKKRRKRTNYLLSIEHTSGDDNLQLVFAPFYRGHLLPAFNSPWCATNCQFAQPAFATPPTGITVTVIDEELDRDNLDHAELSLRYSSRFERLDYSLVMQSGFDKFPLWSRRFTGADSVLLNREMERRWRVGGDFATTLSSISLRSEFLYQFGSVQHLDPNDPQSLADEDGLEDVDQLSWIVGFDGTFANDIYYNLQYAENRLLESGNYFRNTFESLVTANVSKTFLDEDWELATTSIIELNDASYGFSPELTYQVMDGFKMAAGFWIFGGDTGDFFGDFRDNDHFFFTVSYEF